MTSDAAGRSSTGVAELGASWSSRREQIPAWDLNVALLSTVESTQQLARRLLDRFLHEGDEPLPYVVGALEQRAGRGRQGRTWESPRGGLYASLVIACTDHLELGATPVRAAVALATFLNSILDARCRIKWPNDVVVGRRKIGGVLVDAVPSPENAGSFCAVIGFGVNFEVLPQPPSGAEVTSVLAESPDCGWSLADFTSGGIAAVWRGMSSSREEAIERFSDLSAHHPGEALECRIGDERVQGNFRGFDDRGFLVLETDGGERVVSSGEVFAW